MAILLKSSSNIFCSSRKVLLLLSNQDLLVTQIISTYIVKFNLNELSLYPEC